MKVVLVGAGGQLATDLATVLNGEQLFLFRHTDLDICDTRKVKSELTKIQPDVVINTAAFHRVDDCEDDVERAFSVNTYAVRQLAKFCTDLDSVLVHISTDYVFSDDKQNPYLETDLPKPQSVYGVSKLTGEYFVRFHCPKHFVVRSSGLYGVAGASGKGGNFVETMIRLAREGRPIRVVNDQVLSPTYTKDLAKKIVELLQIGKYGLYHITNNGECSWYEFASKIFELTGLDPDFGTTTTEAFGAKAYRPVYSTLENNALNKQGLSKLPFWQDALSHYLVAKGYLQVSKV